MARNIVAVRTRLVVFCAGEYLVIIALAGILEMEVCASAVLKVLAGKIFDQNIYWDLW